MLCKAVLFLSYLKIKNTMQSLSQNLRKQLNTVETGDRRNERNLVRLSK
jgi:hypothetical protein